MTPQEFCDKVWEILVAGSEPDVTPLGRNEAELETACNEGLQWFSNNIALDEQRYHQFQRAVDVNLTNGVGDLPSDILPESLDNGWIRDANGNFLSKILHYVDLTLPQSPLAGYYCLQNSVIYTREKGSGKLDTTPSPLTVFGNYQITLASVGLIPPTLENDALERVIGYIRSHAPGERSTWSRALTDKVKTVFRFQGGLVTDNTFGGDADGTVQGCQGLWVKHNGILETFTGLADFGEQAPIVDLGAGFAWSAPFLTLPTGMSTDIFEKGQWLLVDRNVVPVRRVVDTTRIELSSEVPLNEPVSATPVVKLLPIIVEVDDFVANISRGSVVKYLSGTLLGVGYGRTYLSGAPVRSSAGVHFDLGKRMKIAIPEDTGDPSIFQIYDAGLPGFWPADPEATSAFPGTFTVTANAPTVPPVPPIGKNAAGLFSIRLTRIRSATGGESNPTDPVEVTLLENGSATISTWPPVWPGQTAWGVFLTPEPLPTDTTDKPGPWYRWAAEDIPIAPDGTTPPRTFTWISQELEGSDLLEFDNDPPPASSFLAVLDDIVILCGTEGKPDPATGLPTSPGPGCRPSKPLNPEAFPASYGTLVGPPEDIVGVIGGVGRLYLGTRNRVHIGTITGNNTQPFQVRPFWHAGVCNSQQLVFVNGELYGYTGFGPTRSAGDGVMGSEEHLFGARVANITRNWVRERVRVFYDPHRNAVVYCHTQDNKSPILLPDGVTASAPIYQTMCLPFMLDTQVWSGFMLLYDPFGLQDFNISGGCSVDGNLHMTCAGFNKAWDGGVFPGLIGYGINTPFVDAGQEGMFKTLTALSLTSHGGNIQGLFIWRNNKVGSNFNDVGELSYGIAPSDSVVVHPWLKLNARHAKTFAVHWAGYWPGTGPRHEINEIAIESIVEKAHH